VTSSNLAQILQRILSVRARTYPLKPKQESTMAKKKASAKRELIDTGRDKRYVRRDSEGKFKESDDVGRSLSQDRKRKAKRTVKAGQGDKGDQKRK
jgi:hypothetical protein